MPPNIKIHTLPRGGRLREKEVGGDRRKNINPLHVQHKTKSLKYLGALSSRTCTSFQGNVVPLSTRRVRFVRPTTSGESARDVSKEL